MLGQDLFGKGNGDNLNRSVLKKAKKKGGGKKLVRIIADNLEDLVEFYFGEFTKHDVRQRYEEPLLKLLGSNPYFIKPLEKLIKMSKKKKNDVEIPKGLNVLLMDNLDEVRILYRKQMRNLRPGNNEALAEDTQNRINTIDALTELLITTSTEICNKLTEKQAKKLEKIGLNEEFAQMLARTWVPAKYLTARNIRRYMFRTNTALYAIQRDGLSKTDDEGETKYINEVGTNLADPDILKEIYEFMLKGIPHKVLISALVGIMLERRGSAFERFTKPQLALYNAITTLVLDLLEGNEVINVTGEKVKGKKAKKELEISKKDLKHFMRMYSDERARDAAKGRDSQRRISFSNLADDSYPKVLKAFKACNKDYFDSMFDAEDERREERKNNNNKNRDKDKDRRDDRDNRNDRRDRDRDRDRNRGRDRDKKRYDYDD